jgi:hypothetical protein
VDLIVGGVAVGIDLGVAAYNTLLKQHFVDLLTGTLGSSYRPIQAELAGFKRRAKRAAVKLLHEGLEKLLSILRNALPIDIAPDKAEKALEDLADWLRDFALTNLTNRFSASTT